MNILKEKAKYPDLTNVEHSVGNSIESLIHNLASMTFNEIQEAFIDIIEDPKTNISQVKINKYKLDLNKIHSMRSLQLFISNIYLRSANLGLK